MNRRGFIGTAVLATLGWLSRHSVAFGGPDRQDAPAGGEVGADRVDPYFLQPPDLSATEQDELETFMKYQEDVMDGRDAVMPRGGKPKRAPTYRFLHWQGELGSPRGRLVGSLKLKPALTGTGPFSFNGQILGFNVSTLDWGKKKGHGTLSIELRARYLGEPMTWLYLEQFESTPGGGNSVGLEYVAQRDGMPEPVICEEPRVDIRIQLIRHNKSPGVLRKVLQVGSFLTGLPLGGGGSGSSPSFSASPPVMRVPQMVREGVAFAQGTVAGMSEEAPVWRSGFNSLALTADAGRLAVRPGLWLAIDDSRETDFSAMRLDDIGGRVGVLVDGQPVDLNYLVLELEVEKTRSMHRREVIPKGKRPDEGGQ